IAVGRISENGCSKVLKKGQLLRSGNYQEGVVANRIAKKVDYAKG
ncbi:6747_t:CDS:1, partial [Cetraspora pellucida]